MMIFSTALNECLVIKKANCFNEKTLGLLSFIMHISYTSVFKILNFCYRFSEEIYFHKFKCDRSRIKELNKNLQFHLLKISQKTKSKQEITS
jgi:hypothetical protein